MSLPTATIKATDEQEVAQVSLDGLRAVNRPKQWGHSPLTLLQWKFELLDGDVERLETASSTGEPLLLCTPKGTEVLVTIVETPSEQQDTGVIEYAM